MLIPDDTDASALLMNVDVRWREFDRVQAYEDESAGHLNDRIADTKSRHSSCNIGHARPNALRFATIFPWSTREQLFAREIRVQTATLAENTRSETHTISRTIAARE